MTLPAETLAVSYPLFDGNGTPTRPSFLVTRIAQLFGTLPRPANPDAQRLLAAAPALELAGRTLRGATDPAAVAARAWFRQHDPAALAALTRAAHTARGRLSPDRVRALYGKRLYLSASKAERFSACRYAYFLQYGSKPGPAARRRSARRRSHVLPLRPAAYGAGRDGRRRLRRRNGRAARRVHRPLDAALHPRRTQ